MTRLALCLVLAAAGCASESVPTAPSAVAAGMKRQEAASNRHPLGKHLKRRSPSWASRSLRRSPVAQPWLSLAKCESGSDWKANTVNGFYGALQFTQQTWDAYNGLRFAARADLATPAEQITVAERVLRSQGWHAWPTCSVVTGVAR